ncbi:hypothetical protein ACEN4B_07715 [Marinilactibacillus psychrotolerans]
MVSTSLLAISPLQNVAAAENPTVNVTTENTTQASREDFRSNISHIKQMVEIGNKGHLELKDNVSQEDFEKYDLSQLEEHFVTLNQKVDQGIISINSELEIQESNNIVTISASGPTREYHWWGYKTTYTDSQTDSAISTLNSFAAGTAGVWFPAIGAGAGVSSAYASLLASRMGANKDGNGVIVDMTWAADLTYYLDKGGNNSVLFCDFRITCKYWIWSTSRNS